VNDDKAQVLGARFISGRFSATTALLACSRSFPLVLARSRWFPVCTPAGDAAGLGEDSNRGEGEAAGAGELAGDAAGLGLTAGAGEAGADELTGGGAGLAIADGAGLADGWFPAGEAAGEGDGLAAGGLIGPAVCGWFAARSFTTNCIARLIGMPTIPFDLSIQ
jgi:hypothetical protein